VLLRPWSTCLVFQNNKFLLEFVCWWKGYIICEQCHLWGIGWCPFIVFSLRSNKVAIVQPLGSPVTSGHNHTVSLTRLGRRDWGERERKGEEEPPSHTQTHSSMEWCELKLRKVQLDKPSEKKALGSSVAKSHACHCQSLNYYHWPLLPFRPPPVPFHVMCVYKPKLGQMN
jgi:hypothetical protein